MRDGKWKLLPSKATFVKWMKCSARTVAALPLAQNARPSAVSTLVTSSYTRFALTFRFVKAGIGDNGREVPRFME
jgi:hypothetical protein